MQPRASGLAFRFALFMTLCVLICWPAVPLGAQEGFEPVPEEGVEEGAVDQEGLEEGVGDEAGLEGEELPVDDQGQPVDDQGQPVDDQGQPVDDQGQPVDDQGQPVEGAEPQPGEGEPLPEGEGVPGEEVVPEGEQVEGDLPMEGDEPAGEEEVEDEADPSPEEKKPPPPTAAEIRLQKLRERNAALKKGVERPGSSRVTGGSRRVLPRSAATPKKSGRTTRSVTRDDKSGQPENPDEGKDSKDDSAEAEGLVARAKAFVTEHQNWIIGALGVGLLGSLAYLFLGSRRRRRDDGDESIDLVPLGHLSAEDEDDGPRRVLVDPKTGKPRKVSSKDDSEYALVVDEEELHIQQGHIERLIDKLVDEQDYEKAYERFREYQLDESAHLKPQARSEKLLARHFLQAGELDKAENVLEHHVHSRPMPEVDPKVFFDLAYISFKRNTLRKSRDYFRTYADREKDARLTQRARRVLEQLEQNLN